LASEVPYNLDAAFRQQTQAVLECFKKGQVPQRASPQPSGDTTTLFAKSGAPKSKWMRWLAGGAGLVLVLSLAMTFLGPSTPGDAAKRAQTNPADPPQPEPESNPTPDSPPPSTLATGTAQPTEPSPDAQAMAAEQARIRDETAARAAAQKLALEEAQRQAEQAARLQELAEAEAAKRAADALEEKRVAEARLRREEQARDQAAALEKARLDEAEATRRKADADAQAAAKSASAGSPENFANSIGMEMVRVGDGFWAGKYEVTQEEYLKVMGRNPSKFKSTERLPVESVNWNEAMEFCRKLTELESKAGSLPGKRVYTLPTQAQWKSCLQGAVFDQAVISWATRRSAPSAVGTLSPNALGMHDVLGNVWEWCLDGADAKTRTALGAGFNTPQVFQYQKLSQTTAYDHRPPEFEASNIGFRCALIDAP
jgi:formylglycine-generating enzyme required for sulfatase activity